MNVPPTIIIVVIVVASFVASGALVLMNKEKFKEKPEIKAEFSSLEFDADDTSYSPQETHSMNQLSKELNALREELLERQREQDARESAIALDSQELEKQQKELEGLRANLMSEMKSFQDQQNSEYDGESLKIFKDASKRWIEQGPEVSTKELQQWALNGKFEEALTIFEQMKAEDKAPMIAFMHNSDDDDLIQLANALTMRDRTLAPTGLETGAN
jgi:pentatricopeptide repeat protein